MDKQVFRYICMGGSVQFVTTLLAVDLCFFACVCSVWVTSTHMNAGAGVPLFFAVAALRHCCAQCSVLLSTEPCLHSVYAAHQVMMLRPKKSCQNMWKSAGLDHTPAHSDSLRRAAAICYVPLSPAPQDAASMEAKQNLRHIKQYRAKKTTENNQKSGTSNNLGTNKHV